MIAPAAPVEMDLVETEEIRVLLIDENELFLQAATEFLQRQEKVAVLRTAARLEAALVGARDFRPTVIVIDPSMSGPDSLGIIPRIRTVLPEVRIVVLTLINSATYRDASLAVGADGFVAKSNMSVDLMPTIRSVARRTSPCPRNGHLLAQQTPCFVK